MNTIVEKIEAWIASKGGASHVIAVTYLGAVAAYAAVPAFQTLCNSVYQTMPAAVHEVLLATIGIIAWYRNTNKS